MNLARVAAVVLFEVRRTATFARLAWWAVLALFPVAIVSLLVGTGGPVPPSRDVWSVILFVLVVIIVCMLSLLLWATPIVNAEVEGNSWPYLAVRPGGKTRVLVGKYLAAVAWSALAGWTGLTISLLITQPVRAFHTWTVLAVLVLLSSISYGALFTFIGVVAHKRPMVVAVGYALILEFVMAWAPAVVNQVTMRLRLQTLMYLWIDWENPVPPEALFFIDRAPAIQQILILLGFSAGLLAAAIWVLRQKTLVSASEA
jgi:hypothetical protein